MYFFVDEDVNSFPSKELKIRTGQEFFIQIFVH